MSAAGTTLDSDKEAGVAGMVWDVLRDVVSARMTETGRPALDIVDVGGGTGGLAVPFAALGHNVTVVDPSPDAPAAGPRRGGGGGGRPLPPPWRTTPPPSPGPPPRSPRRSGGPPRRAPG